MSMSDKKSSEHTTAKALYETLISPNESDSNFEPANVVDGLFAIARAINRLAAAFKDGAPFKVDVQGFEK